MYLTFVYLGSPQVSPSLAGSGLVSPGHQMTGLASPGHQMTGLMRASPQNRSFLGTPQQKIIPPRAGLAFYKEII